MQGSQTRLNDNQNRGIKTDSRGLSINSKVSGSKNSQSIDWNQEYNQQSVKEIKMSENRLGSDTKKNAPVTQQQTHTGSGAQQNLYIKNLFFIQGGPRNQEEGEGSQSSRNALQQRLGSISQSYEWAPNSVSSRVTNTDMPNSFTDIRVSQLQKPKIGPGSNVKLQSPKIAFKDRSKNTESSETKTALDIASQVLEHLAPYTDLNNKLKNFDQMQDSIGSLRVAVQQAKKDVRQQSSDKNIRGNNSLTHAKSVSPNKNNSRNEAQKKSLINDHEFDDVHCVEAIDVNESATLFKDDSLEQLKKEFTSPGIKNSGQVRLNQTQQISIFNKSVTQSQSRKKKPSYGDYPKVETRDLSYGKVNPEKAYMAGGEIAQKRHQNQSKNHLASSASRNTTAEVFTYKMKTLNSAVKRDQMLKQPINYLKVQSINVTKEYQTVTTMENQSEKESYLGSQSVLKQSRNKSSHNFIKSQSQHQIPALKKQPSESHAHMKSDAMYLSLGNVELKHPPFSQAQDSEGNTSHIKYDSAIGEKHSELSQTTNMVDKQSIKVMARFRPLNNLEIELQEFHQNKSDMVLYDDDKKTLRLQEEYHTHSSNLVFTFDHIFNPQTSQDSIFDIVGRSMIDDIMSGYNGTIFAYGQTGSGKTFTMYGDDLFDPETMGIVPRAAKQIFDHIREQELEVEYSIRIQMVEIYKETLRDLLHNNNSRPPELKIKEDPKRGTYIEGLQDVCIVSEEEIMSVICTGETMRHVASTYMNQVSSRSHSICMIDVVQKYPNDSERRGVLNLVDLAGSERVSKSMASGSALEEAKKINFSLSMLGKVINSLTKHSSHIPYRDSKLTRLLKESLGGNNKTSLIVACSTHYSNYEETLSTLRFAQSAKHIQNKVRLNIKTSNYQLKMIIEQLKQELRSAKEEIFRLRLCSSNQSQIQQNNDASILSVKNDDETNYKEIQAITQTNVVSSISVVAATPLQAIHNRPHQSLLAKNYDVIETNNNQRTQLLQLLGHDLSSFPLQSQQVSPSKNNGILSENQMIVQAIIQRNEDLEMKLQSKEADIEALSFQKEELQVKVTSLEDKVASCKRNMITLENRVAEFETQKDWMLGKDVTQNHKLSSLESQVQILNQQVKCLERELLNSEKVSSALMKEKQDLYKKRISEFFDETLSIMKIPISQGLSNLVSRAKTDTFEFNNEQELKIPLNERDLLMQNMYSLELLNGIEEGSVPPEITIYLLKNQLIDACLANHNLQRVISMTKWRQAIEFGKYQMQQELCTGQATAIATLEQILEKMRGTHDKFKIRVEKLENQTCDNRTAQQFGEMVLWTDAVSNGGSNQDIYTQRAMTQHGADALNRSSNLNIINQHSQSIISGQISNSNHIINTKTRFSKPITSRSVRKMFGSKLEQSPGSQRASIGGRSSQSIMAHYYNMKHQVSKQQLSSIDSKTAGEESGASTTKAEAKINLQQRGRAVSQYNQIQLTVEDLRRIDTSQTLKEVKDLLRSKFREQPWSDRFANSTKKQNNSTSPAGTRINDVRGHTEMMCRVSETSEVQRESEPLQVNYYQPHTEQDTTSIQEVHLTKNDMALGSECLITNNSIIMEPYGLFGATMNTNQQLHFNENLNERIHDKVGYLIEEVEAQRCRAEEYKKAYQECKKQLQANRMAIEEKEGQFDIQMKNEIFHWEQALNQLKALNESELHMKQIEIGKIHKLLAKWIDSYQLLEIKRGIKLSDLENLLLETLDLNRNRQNGSNEVLLTKTGTPNNVQPTPFLNQGIAKLRQQAGYMNSAGKNLNTNLRSPKFSSYYQIQTPQSKGGHHVLMTEQSSRPFMRSSQQNKIYGVSYCPPIATQGNCASPTLNYLMSDKKEHIGSQRLKGDTSPPVHQQSSLDDDSNSDDVHIPAALLSCSPNHNEGIRIKTRAGIMHPESPPFEHQSAQDEEEDKQEEILEINESVDSSQIELNLQSPSQQNCSEYIASRYSQFQSLVENQP